MRARRAVAVPPPVVAVVILAVIAAVAGCARTVPGSAAAAPAMSLPAVTGGPPPASTTSTTAAPPARTGPPPASTPHRAPPATTPRRTPDRTLLVQQMADTRGARQIITVTTAPGGNSPVLQAFQLTAAGWQRSFGPVPAVIGAQGFSTRVSESTTATPIGMFTLTEAFGTAADPGTALPYHRSRYGDVWVDDPTAPTYNTRQAGDADFGKGSGERLWEITTAYEYAVVIDYNRRPVRAGAGSAFFLHVTIPQPSQGCVTARRDRLLWLLRWLDPAAHPMIALGPEATVRTM